jgi:hypothetical protein
MELSDPINPEIVEEDNGSSFSSMPEKVTTKAVEEVPRIKKKLPLKHRMIAELAARCYPIDLIAKQVGLKPKRVYQLLDKSVEIWEEIDRIIKDLFSEGDRMLANLRINALKRLDDHIIDTNKNISLAAIEKVLKVYDYSKGEGPKQAIMNFYGQGGKGSTLGVESMDDFILNRRKERGLLEHKHEGDDEEEDNETVEGD